MKEEIEALRTRTRKFGVRAVQLYAGLPRTRLAETLGHQAMRAGTSVGAQYREACRARSDAEIISKMESVLQELDEFDYWLDLLAEADVVKPVRLMDLKDETNQLTAIFVATVKNLKVRQRRH